MLEDASGRIQLVGNVLSKLRIVTGVIMAALGVESANGTFSVVDICFAGMPPQPGPATGLIKNEDEGTMEVDGEFTFLTGQTHLLKSGSVLFCWHQSVFEKRNPSGWLSFQAFSCARTTSLPAKKKHLISDCRCLSSSCRARWAETRN